jgi:hypothetical protein
MEGLMYCTSCEECRLREKILKLSLTLDRIMLDKVTDRRNLEDYTYESVSR